MGKRSVSARRAANAAKAEAKRKEAETKRVAKADKEAKSKAVAVATAKEIDALVAELTKLVDEAEASMHSSMHKAAEKIFRLADTYGLTQLKIATLMGRSQPWVSGLLKWKADGYPATPFGPQANKARAIRDERLLVTNNPAPPTEPGAEAGHPDLRVNEGQRHSVGPKLALPPDKSVVPVTGNDVDTEASAEARKAAMTESAWSTEAPATAEPPAPEPKHEQTPEQKSDDALAAFKAACNTQCPLMTEADLKQARVYFMEQRWKPRGSMKAA
jgi:hypothetical protein